MVDNGRDRIHIDITIAHDTPSEAEVLPIPYSLSPPQDLFSSP
ncbi:MAG: hypothetical protein RID53_04805 [Coleofasciculus sp. B1-GNL1-01]